jgi:hypothetical protein
MSEMKLFQRIYLELCGGYEKCKVSFEIWRFMMTNDLNRLYERCHGLNGFDEFYAYLGGSWRGVK